MFVFSQIIKTFLSSFYEVHIVGRQAKDKFTLVPREYNMACLP